MELIYDIHFPAKEKWIVQDSKIYKITNDSVYFTEEIPLMNEFTVFHLALNSNLTYFGLDEAKFSISNIDKKGVKNANGWIFGGISLGFYLGNIWGSGKSARTYNQIEYEKLYNGAKNSIYSHF